MVVVVFGLPGSGKSYFASRLAGILQAQYLSSDILRKHLLAARKYTRDEKEQVYDKLLEQAQNVVLKGEKVVLDATFYTVHLRRMCTEAFRAVGQKTMFIEIWAEEALIRERLKQRRLHSEADYSIYLKVKEFFQPMFAEHLLLQSKQDNISQMLDLALQYIRDHHE